MKKKDILALIETELNESFVHLRFYEDKVKSGNFSPGDVKQRAYFLGKWCGLGNILRDAGK